MVVTVLHSPEWLSFICLGCLKSRKWQHHRSITHHALPARGSPPQFHSFCSKQASLPPDTRCMFHPTHSLPLGYFCRAGIRLLSPVQYIGCSGDATIASCRWPGRLVDPELWFSSSQAHSIHPSIVLQAMVRCTVSLYSFGRVAL